MAPIPMRRLLVLLLVIGLELGAGLFGPPIARGQEQPVVVRLASQSIWNAPDVPLRLSISATNLTDAPLDQLSVVVAIEAPARSRSVYELSLREDATAILSSSPFVQDGVLDPGATRVFPITEHLAVPTQRAESALYPLRVQLLSADIPVATLRTPMIFLAEPGLHPVNFTWSWELSEPLQYGPDGVFFSDAIERDIATGGALQAAVSTLQRLDTVPLVLALSPLLADQLGRMAKGYVVAVPGQDPRTVDKGTGGAADATAMLSALHAIAARQTTELAEIPSGNASIPALIRAGWGQDVGTLVTQGRDEVGQAIRIAPGRMLFRPVESEIDPPSLVRLVGLGVRTILLDPGFLPAPRDLPFSPPPLVRLSGGKRSANAVTPDPGVVALATDPLYQSDPKLAARAALGEIAATWLEFPGTPGRGVAALIPDPTSPAAAAYPPGFAQFFANAIAESPWLKPITATELTHVVQDYPREALGPQTLPAFGSDYVGRVDLVSGEASRFSATAVGPKAAEAAVGMGSDILHAKGRCGIVDPPVGDLFLDAVHRGIAGAYGHVRLPTTGRLVTLTSENGLIPMTVRNESGYTLRVLILFVADRRVSFPRGDSQQLLLQPRTQAFTFSVRVQTTGRFPVKVQLRTLGPAPPDVISETQIVVRSTAYNRVALFVTIGAALFLLAWWGRRFLPRRSS